MPRNVRFRGTNSCAGTSAPGWLRALCPPANPEPLLRRTHLEYLSRIRGRPHLAARNHSGHLQSSANCAPRLHAVAVAREAAASPGECGRAFPLACEHDPPWLLLACVGGTWSGRWISNMSKLGRKCRTCTSASPCNPAMTGVLARSLAAQVRPVQNTNNDGTRKVRANEGL